MQIKFDSNQSYQLDAIASVVDVLEGAPLAQGTFTASLGSVPGELMVEEGIANFLALSPDTIADNIRAVQTRNGITPKSALPPLVSTLSEKDDEDKGNDAPQVSLEMETGTGKTYVYLRTFFELNARYGLKKFVIVVPSVAIREGVLQTLRQTEGHFRSLYNGVPATFRVYDSKQASYLRQFAISNQIQILVTNIQAFNTDNNIMRQESDRLSGRRPLDFLQATRPVVVLDEPQNLDSVASQKAIADLHPLLVLRYSATHKNPPNLLYRLDPVKAYDLGLVKHIEVDSVLEDNPDFNRPHIRLLSVNATAKSVSAKLELDIKGATGPVRAARVFTFKTGQEIYDLYELSGQREVYRGYVIEDIRSDTRKVCFANGYEIGEGAAHGGNDDAKMQAMVRQTVSRHLEKERDVACRPDGQKLKVLSLFFIDRVANYTNDDGKIRRAFVDAYQELASLPRFATLNLPPLKDVHNGYFAQDKTGAKDTSGTTQADTQAYELIMKDKERLLSRGEPLRFIFSHSALSEGWDNPNVFQICTLNELQSATRKRQQIGRGLRLPVMESGERCHEDSVNRLTVVANESFKEFAADLQREIKEETGADFTGRVSNARKRYTASLKKDWRHNPYFIALWERICHRTRYRVEYDTETLIQLAADKLKMAQAIAAPRFQVSTMSVQLTDAGVSGTRTGRTRELNAHYRAQTPLPDILSYLQAATHLTRPTLAAMLRRSGRLGDIWVNPQQFLDRAATAISAARDEMLLAGIKYEKWNGQIYEMQLWEDREIESYRDRMVDTVKSVYDALPYDSAPELKFAELLESLPEVKLFLKMPGWFKIETPLGSYNPDWAIVVEKDGTDLLYCIRETKGTTTLAELTPDEQGKVHCGKRHFDALGIGYKVVNGNAPTLDIDT